MAGDFELGCAERYDAVVHYQGGRSVWARIDGLTALSWGRKLDDYSEASVTVAKPSSSDACLARLGRVQAWAHELSIYRDGALVWQGPIVQVDEHRDSIVLDARDMISWLDRRALHPLGPTNLPSWRWHYHWWEPRPAGEIIGKIVDDAFSGGSLPDPGLRAHARLDRDGPLATTDLMYGDTQYCGEPIREVLQVGMDMFTLGRKLYVVAEDYRLDRAPYRLHERHFLDELIVRKVGLDTATRGITVGGDVLDGNGDPMDPFPPSVPGQPEMAFPPIRGSAGGPETGYGLVERITESSKVQQQTVAAGIAARIRAHGFPPPAVVLVPEGARLDPSAPVSVGQLVPGRMWRVELANYLTPIAGTFRLSEVEATWSKTETEQVAVALVTATPEPTGGQGAQP